MPLDGCQAKPIFSPCARVPFQLPCTNQASEDISIRVCDVFFSISPTYIAPLHAPSNSQISGGRARLSIPSYYETTISPQAAIIRGFHIRTRGTIVTMAETDLQLSTAICVYSVRSLELTVSRKLPRSSDSRKDIYLSRKSGDQKHYVF